MSGTASCPICGGPNECGAAQGQSVCWCFSAAIPADVLARVPESQRNVACVCQKCAEAKSVAEASASRQDP